MERPNWVYWQDQNQWRAYPDGSPDREIQAASFDELQFKVQQLSRDTTKISREIARIEQPKAEIHELNIPKYILSQDQGKWRGHLESYPDSSVQGESFDEVQFKLWQLYRNLIAGKPSNLRKIA
ncbi:MAG: hypothetical protein HP496_14520 [Nitrospira sp.]|nr:hypothetical protein [Nitrospira sp.]